MDEVYGPAPTTGVLFEAWVDRLRTELGLTCGIGNVWPSVVVPQYTYPVPIHLPSEDDTIWHISNGPTNDGGTKILALGTVVAYRYVHYVAFRYDPCKCEDLKHTAAMLEAVEVVLRERHLEHAINGLVVNFQKSRNYIVGNLKNAAAREMDREANYLQEARAARDKGMVYRRRASRIGRLSIADYIEDIATWLRDYGGTHAKNIDLRNNKLTATTPTITLEGVDLGPFDVTVVLDTCAISFVTRGNVSSKGYSHPHINIDGYPCWGDALTTVLDLTAARDVVGVLIQGLTLLYSYNPGSPYQELAEWHETETWYCDHCEESHSNEESCPYHCADCDEYTEGERHTWCNDGVHCYVYGTEEYHQCPNCETCYPSMCGCCDTDDHCGSCCDEDFVEHTRSCAHYVGTEGEGGENEEAAA